MPVNQTLATFSDTAFQTAFVIYLLALVLSLVHYVKMQGVIDARRAREVIAHPEYVAVGAGSGTADLSDRSTGDVADDPVLTDEQCAAREASADKFGGMTQTVVWLGAVVHLVSVVLRGLATDRFPLGNMYEYISMICVLAVLTAAITIQRREWRSVWPWLLVPVLVMLFFAGTSLYADSAPVVPALQSYWLPIHVSTVSVGAAIGIVSGIASLLYLLRIWQPKGAERGFFGAVAKPLPSAKKLDGLAYKSAIITLPVLGLGIVLGAIWAEAAWGRFWGWDPKETASFISWVLYAAYLHARATAGWRDHKAAWINILALATMIFNLFFINLVVSGLHSYAGLN
ncbi:c-type cytochrome biogenesis protein CcsB [Corynebacterium marinum]|uniref:Cytochrome C assembly protein n=1 Tax=Corynebacterium marinum DSM 44953 TaxID=1224162 RepID=A0A0B6TZL5_9CORY|nr:c-type cytochrome biogenesis protein CcsB [Corynebacterium marinum]AJK70151.1 cytochrome C assembly protein [Corynebacterium marinum DSM 44953]GGO22270.1 c-type cytochrome biogenesis protein CcsB [Corynebacterium marinum]